MGCISGFGGQQGRQLRQALAETVNGLYKAELIRRGGPWRSVEDVKLATLAWVDWCNTERLHSASGYVSPAEHEQRHAADLAA